jgi:hydroxymethylpyrimidine pyrophosphatase-like HAD family hydrolase
MYFIALASDYDGTLAEDGRVAPATLEALDLLKQSGRKLILVTGRELPDLQGVFPELDRFALVVAENGALLYEPATETQTLLGPEPPVVLIDRLKERRVSPLSIGRCIVATLEPNEQIVLETIRELGLEMQIIFNKGAVMVLPAGVNKATGLAAALERMKLSPLNVVGIGDAENDHAFLSACGCAVAVANALPMVKEDAAIVTKASRGGGVAELIGRLVADDLADIAAGLAHQRVALARRSDSAIDLHPFSGNLLITGTSGGGKSSIATGLLKRLAEGGFQFCVIDPEGDYAQLEGAVTVGDAKTPPSLREAVELLEEPCRSVVVDLTGLDLAERPRAFADLAPELSKLRARTARPHWLLIDEAHHLLPVELGTAAVSLPRDLNASIVVTGHPDQLALPVLEAVRLVLTVGANAAATMRAFCQRTGDATPWFDATPLERDEAWLWDRRSAGARRVHMIRPHARRWLGN